MSFAGLVASAVFDGLADYPPVELDQSLTRDLPREFLFNPSATHLTHPAAPRWIFQECVDRQGERVLVVASDIHSRIAGRHACLGKIERQDWPAPRHLFGDL